MSIKSTKTAFLIGGAIVFNLVFWNEKLGLNTAFFDALIIIGILSFYPDSRKRSVVLWLLAAHLLCLGAVLFHNTTLSKFGLIATLILFAGFAQYYHRSLWYAGGSMLLNLILLPASMTELLQRSGATKRKNMVLRKAFRFAIVPLLLLGLFTMLYSFGNNIFSEWTTNIGTAINKFFNSIFANFSWPRFFFFLLGLGLAGFFLLKSNSNYFSNVESKSTDELSRKKLSLKERLRVGGRQLTLTLMGKLAKGNMAIKNLNLVGIISLVLLNLLLLVINIIDVSNIWFNPGYVKNSNLYNLIHEGTDLLIFSIVLAMLVLLIFFKGNLNFYQRNKWLKYGAYAWIIQNSILVISVLLRDYYYIRDAGLAYKRIGVLFFLALVLFGLITVFIKIRWKKTNYYLMRVNAWAVIVLLVGSTMVNWDEYIARYNIAHKETTPIDVDFMASLGNKALPILDRHIDDLKKHGVLLEERGFRRSSCADCWLQKLKSNKENYLLEQNRYSWLSWNYADQQVKEYFSEKERKSNK